MTSKRTIPSVRRATPARPRLALRPGAEEGEDDDEDEDDDAVVLPRRRGDWARMAPGVERLADCERRLVEVGLL